MIPKTLCVRARHARDDEPGPPLVQDHERLERGINAFVGVRFQEIEGKPGEVGFHVTGESVVIPYRPEYVDALKKGSLLPADEATAAFVGVPLEANTGSTKDDVTLVDKAAPKEGTQ